MTEATPLSPAAAPPAAKVRAAIEYSIGGDLRYLSHHDELRMLTRALVRARWPLAYSAGFNPQPFISIVLPRRTGTAADAQLAIVAISESCSTHALAERLSSELPRCVRLLRVCAPLPPGTPQALRATFETEIESEHARELDVACRALLSRATLVVERQTDPARPARKLDIRQFIERLDFCGAALRMTLRYDGQLSARPIEVTTLLGLPAERYEHRLRRVEVTWNREFGAALSGSPSEERESIGQEEDHQSRSAGVNS